MNKDSTSQPNEELQVPIDDVRAPEKSENRGKARKDENQSYSSIACR